MAIICMAGGDTAPIRNGIIKYCEENGIKTIGTNGVFGIDEKVKGGVGVMGDDIIAGIAAGISSSAIWQSYNYFNI